MDPYIGEIRCFGFDFAPVNWALCDGQLMSIAQNTALFSIIGTFYGGNGQTTFALPDLRGHSPMHWGSSPNGFNTVIGEILGQSTVSLTTSEMPSHYHTVNAASLETGGAPERSAGPNANGLSYLSQSSGGLIYQPPPATPDTKFADAAISIAGNSQPHENMQPYLTMSFCISLYGVFPSRN